MPSSTSSRAAPDGEDTFVAASPELLIRQGTPNTLEDLAQLDSSPRDPAESSRRTR